MTEFMRAELLRLVHKIPETDPCGSEYHTLLRSIEYLDSMGSTIEEILAQVFEDQVADDLAAEKLDVKEGAERVKETSAIKTQKAEGKVVPFTAPDFPEATEAEIKSVPESAESPSEAKTYDPSEVRKALVDAKKNGVDIKAILAKVGVENFQAVPAAKYGIIMKELEAE